MRKDDVLVVWKLDRLSRSLKDVLTLMQTVKKAGEYLRGARHPQCIHLKSDGLVAGADAA